MWDKKHLREESGNKGRKEEWRRERQEERARGQEEVTEAQDAKVNVIIQQLGGQLRGRWDIPIMEFIGHKKNRSTDTRCSVDKPW